MADIKLTYFHIKGRAELSRLILAAGGKKYTDERFVPGQWDKPETKASKFNVTTLMLMISVM